MSSKTKQRLCNLIEARRLRSHVDGDSEDSSEESFYYDRDFQTKEEALDHLIKTILQEAVKDLPLVSMFAFRDIYSIESLYGFFKIKQTLSLENLALEIEQRAKQFSRTLKKKDSILVSLR